VLFKRYYWPSRLYKQCFEQGTKMLVLCGRASMQRALLLQTKTFIKEHAGTRRDDGLEGLLLSEHVLSTVPPVADFSRDPVRDAASHRPPHHIVPTSSCHCKTGPHPHQLVLSRVQVLAQHRRQLIEHNLWWVGYLSSTSVYGNHGGGWVDER